MCHDGLLVSHIGSCACSMHLHLHTYISVHKCICLQGVPFTLRDSGMVGRRYPPITPNFGSARARWRMAHDAKPWGIPASFFRAEEQKPITVDAEMRQLEVALSHDQWEAVPGRALLWARVVEILHANPALRSILVVPTEFDVPGLVSAYADGRARLTSPFCPADTALRADIRRLSRAELIDLVTAPTRGCVHFAEDVVRRALAFKEYPWLRNIPGSISALVQRHWKVGSRDSTMMEVLPPELLTLVLGSLEARSLLRASAASVSLRTLAHQEELWRLHCLRSLGLGASQLTPTQLEKLRALGARSFRKLYWQTQPLKPILSAVAPGARSLWSYAPLTPMPDSLRQLGAPDWVFVEFCEVDGTCEVETRRVSVLDACMRSLKRLKPESIDAGSTSANIDVSRFPECKLDFRNQPLRVASDNGQGNAERETPHWLEWRFLMQINGSVVPVWDTFAANGDEDSRYIGNSDKITFSTDIISDLVPEMKNGLLVTGIDFRFYKDGYDAGEPEPGDPEKVYGSGEAGFLNVFSDLQSALRACSDEVDDMIRSRRGENWLGGNLPNIGKTSAE